MPLLFSKYNHAINLSVTNHDDLIVPINYYSDTKDIVVVLEINKLKKLNREQNSRVVESVGKRQYILQKTDFLSNGLYVFSTILDKRDLLETGVYTGTIAVKQTYRDNTDVNIVNEILDIVPITLEVSPNPLDIKTKIMNLDNTQKTLKDTIVEIFETLYQKPTGNGYIVESEHIVVFKGDTDGGYLPLGSTFTVYKKDGKNVVLTKYNKMLLERTSISGEFNGEQITDNKTPASIARISGLETGEYYVYSEAVNNGRLIRSEDVIIHINSHFC